MHDMYENQTMPVLFVLGVFILVLVYCRLTVGDVKTGTPPPAASSRLQAAAGSEKAP